MFFQAGGHQLLSQKIYVRWMGACVQCFALRIHRMSLMVVFRTGRVRVGSSMELTLTPYKNTGKLSFTTSPNMQPFLDITIHWISRNWELYNCLLNFVQLSGAYSSENLDKVFINSCQELGILAKLI
ncbi:hypothetical protein BC937DRAFT_89208 [Endogone sp. FLAS-F59071]|nr:hypothetical protein BC937DRAFT_89208 [Endogone sp. FLAS-F59071]|eukprot:RUS18038.1 hypothetical protein BC937DRAFT_89208 [Endogone sp. FLAS-F59071]